MIAKHRVRGKVNCLSDQILMCEIRAQCFTVFNVFFYMVNKRLFEL